MAYTPETMLHILLQLEDCTIEDSQDTDRLCDDFLAKKEIKEYKEKK
jgi:hypothetical protein